MRVIILPGHISAAWPKGKAIIDIMNTMPFDVPSQ